MVRSHGLIQCLWLLLRLASSKGETQDEPGNAVRRPPQGEIVWRPRQIPRRIGLANHPQGEGP